MTTTAMPSRLDLPAWTVRPERPLDLDQIHELHREAFGGDGEAELVDTIRSGPAFIPELSLVAATDDGSILGHILLSRIELLPAGDDAERVSVLALAPLAVLPQHQRSGIGSALVARALEIADGRDEPMIVVLGAPVFYGRFGFGPALDHDVSGPYDNAGDAFQVRARPGAAIPSGSLVYPAAFAGV